MVRRYVYGVPETSPHGRAPFYKQPVSTTNTAASPSRNVVSIPVHFVDSVNKRSNSVLKIQKTFRGFRVRKTVKKILELKRGVDAVEKKLHQRETMEAIKKEEKERLKINETLMALLFKLDSVRGFNDEVRDSRKAVIRKAIMLQEFIDSAVVGGDSAMKNDDSEEVVEEEGGIDDDSVTNDDSSRMYVEEKSGVIEDDFSKMQVEDSETITEESETTINSNEISNQTLERNEDVIINGRVAGENWECVGEETGEGKLDSACEEDDPADNHCKDERNSVKDSSNDEWCVVRDGGGEEKESKDKLLQKMAEDNQRLMAMVTDLCQKNSVQTKMICSLSQRVDQLEKAMSERLRKKKKCNVLHN
ncbi:BAG family molecular chaperone regulator 5 mitochondrial [Bienertia sinuspersici]